MDVIITPLSKEYIKNIAYLHCKYLSGLLSELGPNVTRIFYENALLWDGNFGYVCKQDGKLIGFVFATTDNQEIFKRVIKVKPLRILIQILISIFKKPILIKKMINFFTKEINNTNFPELSYIAIEKDFRKRGIGSMFIKKINDEYRGRNIFYYELSVDKSNLEARKFYEKKGFKLKYEYKQHGIIRCKYYINL